MKKLLFSVVGAALGVIVLSSCGKTSVISYNASGTWVATLCNASCIAYGVSLEDNGGYQSGLAGESVITDGSTIAYAGSVSGSRTAYDANWSHSVCDYTGCASFQVNGKFVGTSFSGTINLSYNGQSARIGMSASKTANPASVKIQTLSRITVQDLASRFLSL